MALCLLPIAFVYHISHYLTSFLVGIQYTVAAYNDPLNIGADIFRDRAVSRVTTGFFNRLDWVRVIWLTQAGWSCWGMSGRCSLSHRIAMIALFSTTEESGLGHLPLSVFMIAYTLLGFGFWRHRAGPEGLEVTPIGKNLDTRLVRNNNRKQESAA